MNVDFINYDNNTDILTLLINGEKVRFGNHGPIDFPSFWIFDEDGPLKWKANPSIKRGYSESFPSLWLEYIDYFIKLMNENIIENKDLFRYY